MIRTGVQNKEIVAMRKWWVPMTVLGLAGLGALLLSSRGRRALTWLAETFADAPELFWSQGTLQDIERLRTAVDQLADSLGAVL